MRFLRTFSRSAKAHVFTLAPHHQSPQALLNMTLVTVRQLAKLLGHLTSTIQAVFPGPLHFRHLQNKKNRALVHSQTYDSATPLSPQAREELVWWRDNLEAWNGKALVSGSPDL